MNKIVLRKKNPKYNQHLRDPQAVVLYAAACIVPASNGSWLRAYTGKRRFMQSC